LLWSFAHDAITPAAGSCRPGRSLQRRPWHADN
jgi:hypothetical protein